MILQTTKNRHSKLLVAAFVCLPVVCQNVDDPQKPPLATSQGTNQPAPKRTAQTVVFHKLQPGDLPPGEELLEVDFSQVKVRSIPAPQAYPPLAKLNHIQGTVVVEVILDLTGTPIYSEAILGPLELRQAAKQLASNWRFNPVIRDGKPRFVRFPMFLPFKLH